MSILVSQCCCSNPCQLYQLQSTDWAISESSWTITGSSPLILASTSQTPDYSAFCTPTKIYGMGILNAFILSFVAWGQNNGVLKVQIAGADYVLIYFEITFYTGVIQFALVGSFGGTTYSPYQAGGFIDSATDGSSVVSVSICASVNEYTITVEYTYQGSQVTLVLFSGPVEICTALGLTQNPPFNLALENIGSSGTSLSVSNVWVMQTYEANKNCPQCPEAPTITPNTCGCDPDHPPPSSIVVTLSGFATGPGYQSETPQGYNDLEKLCDGAAASFNGMSFVLNYNINYQSGWFDLPPTDEHDEGYNWLCVYTYEGVVGFIKSYGSSDGTLFEEVPLFIFITVIVDLDPTNTNPPACSLQLSFAARLLDCWCEVSDNPLTYGYEDVYIGETATWGSNNYFCPLSGLTSSNCDTYSATLPSPGPPEIRYGMNGSGLVATSDYNKFTSTYFNWSNVQIAIRF